MHDRLALIYGIAIDPSATSARSFCC